MEQLNSMNKYSLLLYILIYALSLVFVWVYSHYYNKKNNYSILRLLVITGIILPVIILQGTRLEVGTDYGEYVRIANLIGDGNEATIKYYMKEPLFLIENIIIMKLTGNPRIFFLINAIVENILLFIIMDNYKNRINITMAYAAYYLICFPSFLNIERQGLACLLVWHSYKYIEEKNFKKFLLFVILATAFHNTAIIYLIMYIFVLDSDSKLKKNFLRFLMVLLIASVFFMDKLTIIVSRLNVLADYTQYFLVKKQDVGSIGLYLTMLLVPLLVIVFMVLRKRKIQELYIALLIIVFVSVALQQFVQVGTRIMYYALWSIIYLIGYASKESKYTFNKVLINTTCLIVCSIYYYRLFYYFGWGDIFPYKSFLYMR